MVINIYVHILCGDVIILTLTKKQTIWSRLSWHKVSQSPSTDSTSCFLSVLGLNAKSAEHPITAQRNTQVNKMAVTSSEEKSQCCKDANSFQINTKIQYKILVKISFWFVCFCVILVVLYLDILIRNFISEIKCVK